MVRVLKMIGFLFDPINIILEAVHNVFFSMKIMRFVEISLPTYQNWSINTLGHMKYNIMMSISFEIQELIINLFEL